MYTLLDGAALARSTVLLSKQKTEKVALFLDNTRQRKKEEEEKKEAGENCAWKDLASRKSALRMKIALPDRDVMLKVDTVEVGSGFVQVKMFLTNMTHIFLST